MFLSSAQIRIPLVYFDQSEKRTKWEYLSKYSGKVVTPSKRQSAGKQGSSTRSRSSSDERKNSAKSPPGSPSLHYQLSYSGEVLTVTILECKVGISTEHESILDRALWLCNGFSNCVFRNYSLL